MKKKVLYYTFSLCCVSLLIGFTTRWWLGALVFGVAVLPLIYKIADRMAKRSEGYASYFNGAAKFFGKIPFNLEVVNLGSNSGLHAFRYENVKGMNWAIGPQSLLHDYNILKNFFSYIKPGGYVVITLCPFSCLTTTYGKSHNLKYYTILHPATIPDFEESERIRALKIKTSPLKEIPFTLLYREIRIRIANMKKRFVNPDVNFDKNADCYVNMWKTQFGIAELQDEVSPKHREEQDRRVAHLREMIGFCIERNLKPILIIPPVHAALARRLSGKFKKNYINDFIRKANSADVPFFDYMDDTRFHRDEYFSDSFLMNATGAGVFTKCFLQEAHII